MAIKAFSITSIERCSFICCHMKIQFENDTIPTNKLNKAFEETSSIIVLKWDRSLSS